MASRSGVLSLASIVAVASSCHGDGAPSGMPSAETSDAGTSDTGASDTGASVAGESESGGDTASSGQPAFTIEAVGPNWIATSTADPGLVVEIDCDDETLDGRSYGIAPVIDGLRFEIAMYGGPLFPLFTPDLDAGDVVCLGVESDDTRLLVQLRAGSYQALDPAAVDEPVPVDAAFSIEGGRLVARLSGLYYTMLTRADTDLRIAHGGGEAMLTVTTGSPAFTEYFDDVTSITADDSIYGHLEIEAAIARLQVQLYDDGSEGFELDLDHTFKERGQASVMSTITFP